MAQYGSQDQMRKTDEYGNHVQESGAYGTNQGAGMGGMQQGTGGMGDMQAGTGGMGGEYGTQGTGTGMGMGTGGTYGTQGTGAGMGMGMGMGTGTHHQEGQQQLRRSDSSSSVSFRQYLIELILNKNERYYNILHLLVKLIYKIKYFIMTFLWHATNFMLLM